MSDTIKYISKVEIKGLWGRFDISWDLNADVNILSGINGSGKSTILNCLYAIIKNTNPNVIGMIDFLSTIFSDCKITFNNGEFVLYQLAKKHNDIQQREKKNDQSRFQILQEEFNKHNAFHRHKLLYYSPVTGTTLFIYYSLSFVDLNGEFLQVDKISTFDTDLISAEGAKVISDETIKTEVDWEIYQLQVKYLDYQLNFGKKVFEAINRRVSNDELTKIRSAQDRFLEIIDSLFQQTGKKINRTENKISFLIGEEKLSPYQLSSGEKQILVILLTVLVQDNKNAIVLMDEPEISLHFDWQKKLIQYIKELNPNVQIILATHSPAVIMEGWMDKVSEVSDLIKLDHKSEMNVSK